MARFRRLGLRCAALLIVGGFLAGAAAAAAEAEPEATQIRVSVALPPNHPVVSEGWQSFIASAEEAAHGTLAFNLFVNGAVVSPARTLTGLSQAEADMGFLAPADNPETFPHAAFLTELALTGSDGLAAAAAITELVLLHCPPCRDEFAKQNLVFLGTYSAAPYMLIGAVPLADAESLRGRKVRTPGSLWDRLIRELGAVPTGEDVMPGKALQSGLADAVIDIPVRLQQPEVWKAATAITRLPFGAYRGASPFTANRAFWSKLSDRQRAALLGAASAGVVAATQAYEEQARTVLALAAERGLTVVDPKPSLTEAVARFAEADSERAAGMAAKRFGIDGARNLLETYRSLYRKYIALFGPLQHLPEVAAVLRREVHDKLDPKTFAIEATAATAGKPPKSAPISASPADPS